MSENGPCAGEQGGAGGHGGLGSHVDSVAADGPPAGTVNEQRLAVRRAVGRQQRQRQQEEVTTMEDELQWRVQQMEETRDLRHCVKKLWMTGLSDSVQSALNTHAQAAAAVMAESEKLRAAVAQSAGGQPGASADVARCNAAVLDAHRAVSAQRQQLYAVLPLVVALQGLPMFLMDRSVLSSVACDVAMTAWMAVFLGTAGADVRPPVVTWARALLERWRGYERDAEAQLAGWLAARQAQGIQDLISAVSARIVADPFSGFVLSPAEAGATQTAPVASGPSSAPAAPAAFHDGASATAPTPAQPDPARPPRQPAPTDDTATQTAAQAAIAFGHPPPPPGLAPQPPPLHPNGSSRGDSNAPNHGSGSGNGSNTGTSNHPSATGTRASSTRQLDATAPRVPRVPGLPTSASRELPAALEPAAAAAAAAAPSSADLRPPPSPSSRATPLPSTVPYYLAAAGLGGGGLSESLDVDVAAAGQLTEADVRQILADMEAFRLESLKNLQAELTPLEFARFQLAYLHLKEASASITSDMMASSPADITPALVPRATSTQPLTNPSSGASVPRLCAPVPSFSGAGGGGGGGAAAAHGDESAGASRDISDDDDPESAAAGGAPPHKQQRRGAVAPRRGRSPSVGSDGGEGS